MSIASNFRNKMDVALNAADKSVGMNPDARRAALFQAFNEAELILIEKEMIGAFMERIKELQNST